ncbi:hypothetical protein [Hymenobacter yonginensis]|uniref:NERD domain-containing protein n=1 Tax=Hymenobacter yonginensis TaxID=748197 RepID=A0ABY7PQ92_9BACT|nr:hypothetical protein [Hymenobacter yonginensis]WBO84924.1 hypothetical protein O9Z63_01465 [Hymenobacter yonginensis]
MLHCLLFEPYASAAAETRAEALQESLSALREGVLLLNLALNDELLDAVLLLPYGVAVLQLLPGGRHLSTDHLTHGPWLLDGQPLPGFMGSENPYQQLQRQRPALAAWLAGQPLLPAITPDSIGAMAVFQELLHIESGLEEQLHQLPIENRFKLVRQPQSVLRLAHQQLPADKLQQLPAETLDAWATALLQPDEDDTSAPSTDLPADDTDDLLTRKARQLWRWLGAEDVPADPPYGAAAPPVAPDALADSQQEKARLEQIRQQIRAEVSEQTQALQTREAARDQTIAQLRQQLTEASAAAPETARLQAQLAAEAHEKAALEAAIQAARAESDARNRDLDARIQQLSQQLQQLQARPAAPAPLPAAPAPARPVPPATASATAPALTSAPARAAAPAARPATRRPAPAPAPATWRLQWPRVALAGAVALLAGAGIWGAAQLPGLLRKPAATVPSNATRTDGNEEAAAPTLFDIQPDTIQLTPTEAAADSAAAIDEQVILDADSLVVPAPADEVMDTLAAPPADI